MSIGRFLNGIAALIWYEPPGVNQPAQYLLMRRSAQKDFLSDDWECVTGRVDQGESYTQALHREVREETGASVQIEFLIGVTHFYRGTAIPENELLGALFGCTIADPSSVTFEAEHSEMRWVTAEEAETMLPEKHWLRWVLRRAEMLRALLSVELRQVFRQEGFES
jgi:8-oxo-dGTP diphosphatase